MLHYKATKGGARMFSGKRLKEIREEKQLSQTDIAEKLHINRSSYNKWETGVSKPNQKNLVLLSQLLEVEPSYFESEHAIVVSYLKLNEENQLKASAFVNKLLSKQLQEERERKVLELFPVRVLRDVPLSAGLGDSYYDEYDYETVYTDREVSYDVAAYIKGDSMLPDYLDGEVALINETGFDYSGAVYAIYLNGQTFIKKVYKEDDHYRIVSLNDKYEDKYAYQEDEFRIVGKVISHFMPVIGAGGIS